MEAENIEITGPEIYPNIYKGIELLPRNNRKIVGVLIGASGSGKDRIVCEMMNRNLFKHIVTATSRLRRFKANDPAMETILKLKADSALTQTQYDAILKGFEDCNLATVEPITSYTWMRWQVPSDGTEGQYYENLRQEYQLIESDPHNGYFYGLPKAALVIDGNPFCIPVIRNEINGAITLNSIIPADEFQVINFAVLPDSEEQTVQEITSRASNISTGEIEARRLKNIDDQIGYHNLINYYIKNTRSPINGRPGIDVTIDSLSQLTVDLLQ